MPACFCVSPHHWSLRILSQHTRTQHSLWHSDLYSWQSTSRTWILSPLTLAMLLDSIPNNGLTRFDWLLHIWANTGQKQSIVHYFAIVNSISAAVVSFAACMVWSFDPLINGSFPYFKYLSDCKDLSDPHHELKLQNQSRYWALPAWVLEQLRKWGRALVLVQRKWYCAFSLTPAWECCQYSFKTFVMTAEQTKWA